MVQASGGIGKGPRREVQIDSDDIPLSFEKCSSDFLLERFRERVVPSFLILRMEMTSTDQGSGMEWCHGLTYDAVSWGPLVFSDSIFVFPEFVLLVVSGLSALVTAQVNSWP